MKSLVKALLLAVFVAAPCLAQQSPSTVIGDHATVGTNGTQADGSVNLITRNAGPINFYTDNTKRGSISATGAFSWLSSIGLPNNTYLTSRNAANTADINIAKVDANDDTVINSSAGDYLIFNLEDDANRQVYLKGTSDTLMYMAWGDSGTTAAQSLEIRASTADADDDSTLFLSAGGAVNLTSRGAYIGMYGNEATSTGALDLATGNISTADMTLDATDDLKVRFAGNSTRVLTFDAAANTELDMTWGDAGATAAQVFSIGASTADGDDDSSLLLCGGGGKTAGCSSARGGYIQISGNERSGDGDVQIVAGSDGGGGGAVAISANATDGFVSLTTGLSGKVQMSTNEVLLLAEGTTQFGQKWTKYVVHEVVSLPSGATVSSSTTIPQGAMNVQCVARVTTVITGATTWTYGLATTDVDLYGASLALTSGGTFTSTSYTASPQALAPLAAARAILFTANGANFTGGAVRVSCSYETNTAPTS